MGLRRRSRIKARGRGQSTSVKPTSGSSFSPLPTIHEFIELSSDSDDPASTAAEGGALLLPQGSDNR
ncbi:hypothetical protein GUJ93_ZPchr0005g16071 [Zizania palustris]|uniref:Uncharacterized protein n=1 Tax=Zizania palustris TaxID=103762 RepID=A0A8J5T9Z4_ZIZPA|nr:hypothetical protein GUJ93_ZPchr0005g16071 [Zizania palustris]